MKRVRILGAIMNGLSREIRGVDLSYTGEKALSE